MKGRSANAIFSFLLLASGTGAAYAETGPFRVAVIGDSVAWGQGLHSLQKFSTKVHQHLQNNLGGRPVSLQQWAHSGAVIGFSDPPCADEQEAARSINGEVPTSFPSIAYQAARQVSDPANIDLVLMSAGINDVDLRTVMDVSTSTEWLRNRVSETLRQRLPGLLNDVVVPGFPKATILVTNYYPAISEESSPRFIVGAFSYTLGTVVTDGWALAWRPVLAQRWRVFHEESTAAIRAAVADANARYGTDRVRFVDSGFGPANAVGASAPWLYGPDEIDPVDYWRRELCDAYRPDLICYRANTGHPNRFGAEAYTAALLREISPLIPRWRETNTPGTLALRVVTNGSTTSTLTITVYATDAITAAPLGGTVSINGMTAPTGARITYRRCPATEEIGKQAYGPCPGQVSVAGYQEAAFER